MARIISPPITGHNQQDSWAYHVTELLRSGNFSGTGEGGLSVSIEDVNHTFPATNEGVVTASEVGLYDSQIQVYIGLKRLDFNETAVNDAALSPNTWRVSSTTISGTGWPTPTIVKIAVDGIDNARLRVPSEGLTTSASASVTVTTVLRIKGSDGSVVEDSRSVSFSKGIAGITGQDGKFLVYQYRNATSPPSTPTGGSYSSSTLTTSSDWESPQPSATSGTNQYESQAYVDTNLAVSSGTKQIEQFTDNGGVSGKVVTVAAVSESLSATLVGPTSTQTVVAAVAPVTRIGVTGTTAGTMTAGAKEQTDLSFSGTSGSNDLVYERYTIALSGTWDVDGSTEDTITLQEVGNLSVFGRSRPAVPDGTYTSEEFATSFVTKWNELAFGVAPKFTATSSGSEITFVADNGGNVTDIEIYTSGTTTGTNTGDPSSFTLTKDNDGSGAAATNVSIGFPTALSANPVAFDLTASSTGTSVDTQVKTALDAAVTAGTLTGATISAVTGATRVVNDSDGNTIDITVTLTNPGTLVYTGTVTDGSIGGGSLTGLTATVGSPHTPISHSFTLPSGTLIAAGRPLIRNVFLNDISGFTASAIGSNTFFDITSTTAQAEDDVTLAITNAGTGGDLVVSANTTTTGVDSSTTGTLDTWTIVARGVTRTGTFTSGATATEERAQIGTELTSNPITGVTVSGTGTNLVLTSTATGNEVDYTLVITSNGSAGSPAITRTQGVSASSSGTLTTCTIAFDNLVQNDDITFSFASESSTNSRITQIDAALDNVSNLTETSSTNVLTLSHDVARAITATTITYSGGTGSTVTDPSRVVLTAGTSGGSQLIAPWSTPLQKSGTAGIDGINNAVVSVYKRNSSAPTDAPTEVGTFTFSTATLLFPSSATSSNGWHTTVDGTTGTDQLWIRSASAVDRGNTDTLATDEWSGVVQAGSTGSNGINGLSNGTAIYYQRTSTSVAPAVLPQNSSSFNLGTGALAPATNGNWQTLATLSSTGKYLWFTSATASSRTSTDTITSSEWADALLLSQDGSTGNAGIDGRQSASGVLYYSVAQVSAPSAPSATAYNFATGAFTGLTANWSKDATTLAASQSVFYWQVTYDISEVTAGGVQVFNYGTLSKVASFSSIVVAGGAAADINSGSTTINGGKITAGSLAVTDADISGTLSASKISIDGITLVNDDGSIAVGIISSAQVGTFYSSIDTSAANVSNSSSGTTVNGSNGTNRVISHSGSIVINGTISANGGTSNNNSANVTVTTGDGGDVSITSMDGDITVLGNISADGGDATFNSSGGDHTTGDGGAITLNAPNGCIKLLGNTSTQGGASSFNSSGNSITLGSAGSITQTNSAGNTCVI